ncbi:MAG: hypothetical protein ACQ9MH_04585 [Nitrospinales bacterium]
MRRLNDQSSKQEEKHSKMEGSDTSGSGLIKEKGILSNQEERAIKKTIVFFNSENTRSTKYKGMQNLITSYRRMSLEIEQNLPAKKKLISELAKSENPALKETFGFLKKSEAADELRLKTVWQQGHPGGYFRRILGEIEVKNSLITKLNAAIEKSNKLKEEKKKLEQEKELDEKEAKKTKVEK